MNIKKFNYEEEQQIKLKLNQAKNEFTFSSLKVDPLYNQLKFTTAINELKRLCYLTTPNEKLVLLM